MSSTPPDSNTAPFCQAPTDPFSAPVGLPSTPLREPRPASLRLSSSALPDEPTDPIPLPPPSVRERSIGDAGFFCLLSQYDLSPGLEPERSLIRYLHAERTRLLKVVSGSDIEIRQLRLQVEHHASESTKVAEALNRTRAAQFEVVTKTHEVSQILNTQLEELSTVTNGEVSEEERLIEEERARNLQIQLSERESELGEAKKTIEEMTEEHKKSTAKFERQEKEYISMIHDKRERVSLLQRVADEKTSQLESMTDQARNWYDTTQRQKSAINELLQNLTSARAEAAKEKRLALREEVRVRKLKEHSRFLTEELEQTKNANRVLRYQLRRLSLQAAHAKSRSWSRNREPVFRFDDNDNDTNDNDSCFPPLISTSTTTETVSSTSTSSASSSRPSTTDRNQRKKKKRRPRRKRRRRRKKKRKRPATTPTPIISQLEEEQEDSEDDDKEEEIEEVDDDDEEEPVIEEEELEEVVVESSTELLAPVLPQIVRKKKKKRGRRRRRKKRVIVEEEEEVSTIPFSPEQEQEAEPAPPASESTSTSTSTAPLILPDIHSSPETVDGAPTTTTTPPLTTLFGGEEEEELEEEEDEASFGVAPSAQDRSDPLFSWFPYLPVNTKQPYKQHRNRSTPPIRISFHEKPIRVSSAVPSTRARARAGVDRFSNPNPRLTQSRQGPRPKRVMFSDQIDVVEFQSGLVVHDTRSLEAKLDLGKRLRARRERAKSRRMRIVESRKKNRQELLIRRGMGGGGAD